MAVYVDELRAIGSHAAGCFGRREKRACHLMADTLEELDSFRKQLKLRPAWLHGDHYDLTASKRAAAVRFGAVEVSSIDLVNLRKAKRGKS